VRAGWGPPPAAGGAGDGWAARVATEGPPAATDTTGSQTGTRPMTVGTAASRRPGRRARLIVKRVDPWSTLKFSFVYGLAGMIVLIVAVVVLYAIVDAMGVISSVRAFLDDVTDNGNGPGVTAWLGFGRVLGVTIVVGLVNVVLFTAFATLTAFIYNVCTDLVGGVEITLAERNSDR